MSSGPRGVGLIGLGSIGITHARVVRALSDDFDLRCFSGGSPTAAAEAGWPDAVRLPPDDVPHHPDVDLVLICSPSGDHPSRTLAALDADRDVVVEKPLAIDDSDATRVLRRAHDRGRWVATIAQRRFEPTSVALDDMLRAGTLGSPRMASVRVHWWRDPHYYAAASWRRSMADGGGSLMNQGFHAVDLLRWFVGDAVEITAQYGTLAHEIGAEDSTVATVRFDTGALGTISTSTATPPGDPATITLWFDRGVLELGDNRILRWEFDDVPAPDTSSDRDESDPAVAARTGIASGAADPRAIGLGGHLAQWRAIAAAIRDGTPPPVDVLDAAGTIRLLHGIYRAAETGRTIRPQEPR